MLNLLIMLLLFVNELFLFVVGCIILISGIRKEKKAFLWAGTEGPLTKNPAFNIICGAVFIATGLIAFLQMISLKW